jgi:glucose/arabinose dehydrogenase
VASVKLVLLLALFAQPVYVTGVGERVAVVERYGRVVTLQGRVLADLRPQVLVRDPDEEVDQRGLFSVAFASRRRFYVQYVDRTGRERVDVVDHGRRRLLLDLGPATTQHHGGQLQLKDGALYVSTGMGDDPATSQDPFSTGGKILKVDPETGAWTVYAMGLRNPWRFSFAGRWMLIGDVGDAHTEEVDVAGGPGANFGWPGYEGRLRRPGSPDVPGAVSPARTYTHRGGRCAITGGYVVRGRYWYGDLCTGRVWSARFRDGRLGRPKRSRIVVPYLVSFGKARGHLYAVSFSGRVYRLVVTGPGRSRPAS